MKRARSFGDSMFYAGRGLHYALCTQRNLTIQTFSAVMVMMVAMGLKLAIINKVVLVIAIFMVLGMEIVNTSLEAFVDHFSPELTKWAKYAKDTAAGAVLTIASGTIFILLYMIYDNIAMAAKLDPILVGIDVILLIVLALHWRYSFDGVWAWLVYVAAVAVVGYSFYSTSLRDGCHDPISHFMLLGFIHLHVSSHQLRKACGGEYPEKSEG